MYDSVKPGLTGLLVLTALASLVPVAHGDGINGSGRLIHPVDRYGSIVLDGVHYSTDRAVIRINGVPALEDDLRVGNRVIVTGDLAAQEAWQVDYFDTLTGPIAAVHVDDATLQAVALEVLGVTVRIDADSWLHDLAVEDLAAGIRVAISGAWQDEHTVIATSVVAATTAPERVTGPVRSVQDNLLLVGGVSVDRSGAPALDVDVGDQLHVSGQVGADGTLHATAMELVHDISLRTGPLEIEGVLSQGENGLELDGYRLAITDGTVFEGGTADDLVAGADVDLQGYLDLSGRLQVRSIEFEDRARSRVDGVIEWLDSQTGVMRVNGVDVELDDDVAMRDDRDGDHWISPDRLAVGDQVVVMAGERSGRLTAKRIRRDRDGERRLRARAQEHGLWSRLTVANQDFDDALDADELYLDGERVSRWSLLWAMQGGEDVELAWQDDGRIERVSVWRRGRDDDDNRDEDD